MTRGFAMHAVAARPTGLVCSRISDNLSFYYCVELFIYILQHPYVDNLRTNREPIMKILFIFLIT